MFPNNSTPHAALSSLELEKMKKDNELKAALAALQQDIDKKNTTPNQAGGTSSAAMPGNSSPK